MVRVTKAVKAKSKHKKILKTAKGYYGARSRLFKTAKQASIKALQYSFRDRRARKRNMRNLWIARINAAVKPHNTNYSKFMNSLIKKNIKLNRKILSNIAIHDEGVFAEIVKLSKK